MLCIMQINLIQNQTSDEISIEEKEDKSND